MSERSDIEQITAALLQIHKANLVERLVYLSISALSFVVLVVSAIIALVNGTMDITTFLALFGATGVIGLCITRILAVWKDCIELLRAVLLREVENE